ncbi:tetratricopeptide repeat protein [Thiohalomonas denitrificans]|uniref:tetratricopeptide repeat protein n=1 Tax=Thiohalomonas denitrificans TaxID=415747 RepID=UPI0026EEA652|nr:tetratricopeptide repeat protein [Thiohalomonas denitrificans]
MREFWAAKMTKRDCAVSARQAMARHSPGATRPATMVLLFLCSALVAGCASVAPEQTAEHEEPGEVGEMITVKDHASIGSGARADFKAAMAFLKADQYEKGIPLLESVVERAPEAIAPNVNLAIAYARVDKPELAEKRLQHALEVNPIHPVANNEYGMLLRREGRFPEAKGFYRKALQAYPDFQPARKNLGILCDLYMNDPECALENYEAYAEAVPGDEDVQLWIVDLQRRVGN